MFKHRPGKKTHLITLGLSIWVGAFLNHSVICRNTTLKRTKNKASPKQQMGLRRWKHRPYAFAAHKSTLTKSPARLTVAQQKLLNCSLVNSPNAFPLGASVHLPDKNKCLWLKCFSLGTQLWTPKSRFSKYQIYQISSASPCPLWYSTSRTLPSGTQEQKHQRQLPWNFVSLYLNVSFC